MTNFRSDRKGMANQITGPRASGLHQLPIRTPLTARVGQFCVSAASHVMDSHTEQSKSGTMTMAAWAVGGLIDFFYRWLFDLIYRP
jgi:hypothetical protein